MIKAFAEGGAMKRAACSALMDEIEHGLRAATISAEDFDVLQFCRFMRRVYPSSTRMPDAYERFQLMKAMSEGYVHAKSHHSTPSHVTLCLPFIHSFNHPFNHPFNHSIIQSFFHPFIHSYIIATAHPSIHPATPLTYVRGEWRGPHL
jgi:hypothetical protein